MLKSKIRTFSIGPLAFSLVPYNPRDLIEYTARQMRLRNWFWCLMIFYLTR
jgi:hypothetical protein